MTQLDLEAGRERNFAPDSASQLAACSLVYSVWERVSVTFPLFFLQC
ncbi:MAG: hypothetical protein U0163_20890 [Gemmatimonadaceae bacterium]